MCVGDLLCCHVALMHVHCMALLRPAAPHRARPSAQAQPTEPPCAVRQPEAIPNHRSHTHSVRSDVHTLHSLQLVQFTQSLRVGWVGYQESGRSPQSASLCGDFRATFLVTWLKPLASSLSLLLLGTDNPALSRRFTPRRATHPGGTRATRPRRVSLTRSTRERRAAPSEICSVATWPYARPLYSVATLCGSTPRTPLSSGTADRSTMCCETARGHPQTQVAHTFGPVGCTHTAQLLAG